MKALRIIFALLRVPRLFASLLLFPLIGALLVVGAQLFLSGSVLMQLSKAEQTQSKTEVPDKQDFQPLRLILYGDSKPLPAVKVCNWEMQGGVERPISSECKPDRLDVALHLSSQESLQDYIKLIDGNAHRIHLCQTCKPDLEIFVSEAGNKAQVHSIYGVMLLTLLMNNKSIKSQIDNLIELRSDIDQKFGDILYFVPELKAPIIVSDLKISLVFILNLTAVVVLALWLALKAHRKILDYFSKSGALLPMVAATGKSAFYMALWGITAIRVGVFLLASLPVLIIVLNTASKDHTFLGIFNNNIASFILWMFALLSSMSLATLIASLSDLKGRHEFLSIAYKLIPLFLSLFGVFLWGISFFITSDIAGLIRTVLSAFPILGMGPVVLAPVIQPQGYVLLVHAALSLTLVVVLMRKNARWFAAHLEEI